VVTGPPPTPPPPLPPTRTPVKRQDVAKSQGWFFLHHIQNCIKVYINETMHAKCTHVTQVLTLYVL
jgi:hypothetical protein